jgi:hypothetical protein
VPCPTSDSGLQPVLTSRLDGSRCRDGRLQSGPLMMEKPTGNPQEAKWLAPCEAAMLLESAGDVEVEAR